MIPARAEAGHGHLNRRRNLELRKPLVSWQPGRPPGRRARRGPAYESGLLAAARRRAGYTLSLGVSSSSPTRAA
eukprot:749628-Hanusia_phi.AAC.1